MGDVNMGKQIILTYDDTDNIQINCDWNDGGRILDILSTGLGSVMATLCGDDKELFYLYILDTQKALRAAQKVSFPEVIAEEEKETVIEESEQEVVVETEEAV